MARRARPATHPRRAGRACPIQFLKVPPAYTPTATQTTVRILRSHMEEVTCMDHMGMGSLKALTSGPSMFGATTRMQTLLPFLRPFIRRLQVNAPAKCTPLQVDSQNANYILYRRLFQP